MRVPRPAVALAFLATGFLLPTTGGSVRLTKPRVDAGKLYSRMDREYYLTAAQTDYVRPGFKVVVNSVTIGADLKPVA